MKLPFWRFVSVIGFSLILINTALAQDTSQPVDSVSEDSLITPEPAEEQIPPLSSDETDSHKKDIKKDIAPEELKDTVLMGFVKYKTLQNADSLYFNVLKIENRTDQAVFGSVKINIPDGWKLLTKPQTVVNIRPGKSAFVPVRIAVPRNTKGGITYIISALLTGDKPSQQKGETLSLISSCYLSTPRVSNWKMRTPESVIYMSKQNEFEKFALMFENKGNAEELIKLEFEIGKTITVYGAVNNALVSNISIPANMDTVIYFEAKSILPEKEIDVQNWHESSIKVKAVTASKMESLIIWFKYLKSEYINEKNERGTPLTIELTSSNLLSNFNPSLSLYAYGTVLLKNNRDIDYYLNNPGITYNSGIGFSDYSNGLWQRSRIFVQYNDNKNLIVRLGDLGGGIATGIYGRGIQGSYSFSNNTVTATAVRSVYYSVTGGALEHEIRLKTPILNSVRSGLTYSNDDFNKTNTTAGAIGVNLSFLKNHTVNTLVGISSDRHYYNDSTFTLQDNSFVKTDAPDTTLSGWGYNLTYNGMVDKLSFSISSRYGSENYTGAYRGGFGMDAQTIYRISPKFLGTLTYSRYNQEPSRYIRGIKIQDNLYIRDYYGLQFTGRLNRKMALTSGPGVEYLFNERFDPFSDTLVPLSTVSPKWVARLNYRDDNNNIIIPYATMGYTKTLERADSAFGKDFGDILPNTRPFYNAQAGVNIRRKNWGVNAYYYYGPYNIYTQFSYVYSGKFHKSIRIMPYFEKDIIKDKIRLSSYNSYNYDVVTNSERINLHVRLEFYLKKGWTIHVNNNLSLSSRYDKEFGKQSSRGYYFDFGLKKVFDIPQPRVKYYDLKVICYEDLNGNKVMDDNEMGLSLILINIEKDLVLDTITLGRFVYADLGTDQFGEINYYNIPQGYYVLKITPLNSIGDLYNINGAEQKLRIENKTIHYVPFVQANKVVGKVVVIKDEFSSEGAINLGNIRISATDSAGNSFSTLTDRQGKYTLFVPQSGRATITINNVFGDNFILEQEKFLVDFDGFKEFEVIFKFKENPREVNIRGENLNLNNGSLFNERKVNEAPENSLPSGNLQPAPQPDVGSGSANENIPASNPATTIKWEETKYFIVLGSFSDRNNAQRFLDKLEVKSNALLIMTPENTYRVVYGYLTEAEARADLYKRQSIFPAAWISEKK